MADNLRSIIETHLSAQPPPFERIALLLQGGGALGAYQGGVYQALAEAELHPGWVAGISIGAINAALIAGNPPQHRVEKLRAFWETVSKPPPGAFNLDGVVPRDDATKSLVNQAHAFGTLIAGAPGFFVPRLPPPYLYPPGTPQALSWYDTAPLRTTLERLADFDRLNAGGMRLSVGAVNIRTGNFIYFDTKTQRIGPDHVIASGSLPPGFPATMIDGEHYWDGGLVSNTPLQWVLDSDPRADTLAFQVDLWNARGEMPRDLMGVDARQKEIRYSSRTRAATDQFKRQQSLRRAVAKLLPQIPNELQQTPEAEFLAKQADQKVYNIIHLIYHAKIYEGSSKDYEFSQMTMNEHWDSGYNDAVRTLRHPEVLQRPEDASGVFTFDLAVDGRD
jgi:NTE family protein